MRCWPGTSTSPGIRLSLGSTRSSAAAGAAARSRGETPTRTAVRISSSPPRVRCGRRRTYADDRWPWAIDSPQATLLPIHHLRSFDLAPGEDYQVRRHDVLVGKHGDHVGGE